MRTSVRLPRESLDASNSLPSEQLRREHCLARFFVLHVLVVAVVLNDVQHVGLGSDVDRVLRHDLVDRPGKQLDVSLRVPLDLCDERGTVVARLKGEPPMSVSVQGGRPSPVWGVGVPPRYPPSQSQSALRLDSRLVATWAQASAAETRGKREHVQLTSMLKYFVVGAASISTFSSSSMSAVASICAFPPLRFPGRVLKEVKKFLIWSRSPSLR